MRLGMVGLGKMGGNMAERLRRDGHEIVGYDTTPGAGDVDTLAELVAQLPAPRVVWLMVPAGDPTAETVAELAGLLDAGDMVVEGGNSHYRDDRHHAAQLAERGIAYVDAGVSGGVWGLDNGYGIMVGGSTDDIARIQPILDSLTPTPGAAIHAGHTGAGHFVKMVHNGIEYGMMQAFAEGYELMAASDVVTDVPGTFASWREGTVIRSWLLDLLVRALEEDPELAGLRGYAEDSGEGRWTVQAAVDHAVPAPVISSALFARFSSRQDDSPAMKVVAALRHQFGGHGVPRTTPPGNDGGDHSPTG
ncbi:decarboxylating 6-phosphogluconate dehydrogenase [Lipingzhangella sp. LS1_29]|uniref:Decarboxylating 6-phosphogluconate dehydrogenase n=1 Tax=Lipingzhangella rawalii TaxID=2055835 RepID=A0ABU2H840_9ACTN|nr:decarboxylating 6-phosphogluconate dehydrogenase [Lipingzhangella rawalii]MDS1271477.1 decarboxylating 6-phosphogluconate dehydrogenase [Lipingzhangella rawalii]